MWRARPIVLSLAIAFHAGLASAQNAVDLFYPGANSDVRAVALQADGKILVGGSLTMLGGGGSGTTVRNRIGRLTIDGALDNGFNPGANGIVNAFAVQPDGGIVVVGSFTGIGGGCAPTCSATRMRIARLLSNGDVDPAFDPAANGSVTAVALQADGMIVIGGTFTGLGGCLPTCTAPRNRLARLTAAGAIDPNFNPGLNSGATVSAIVVQPDGKILVAGFFTMIGGGGLGNTPRKNIARLNTDGSVDATFNPGTGGVTPNVLSLALQSDGKIVVGGTFTAIGGGCATTCSTMRNHIARVDDAGVVDAFDPGVDGAAEGLAVQANGKITVVGDFSKLGGGGIGTTTRNGIGKLFPDGSLDPTVNPGASSGIGAGGGNVVALALQPDQKIVVVGSFLSLGGITGTSPRTRIGRLLIDGSPEPEFKPGADATVQTLALQPDGRILLGGSFTAIGGILGTTTRRSIGRLNPDGSVDRDFNPGANGQVAALAVQADGSILVGGFFSMIGGGGTGSTPRSRLARLDRTGAVDPTFDPGANGFVHELAILPDGKILVAGDFTMIGGGGTGSIARPYLARLNSNGTVDLSFNPNPGGFIRGLAVQSDGKILVGGNFLSLAGTTRFFIGRYNDNGTLDSGFDPGADNQITVLLEQPDGRILAGGDFTMIGGGTGTTPRTRIARLMANGTVDGGFNPGAGANLIVNSLALQTDGRIIVGGAFTALYEVAHTRSRLGRLNTDGSLDGSFDPGASNTVNALAILPNGTLLAGGDFATLGGGGVGTASNARVGAVANTDPAAQNLTLTNGGTTITWLRGGAGPEVRRTTFESSTDATIYTYLGEGLRIAGGWQLNGQNVPAQQSVYVRARGYYAEGNNDGSQSIFETVRNPYLANAPFTDDPLVVGVTAIKAAHILELRNRIDGLRAGYDLAPFEWTDPSLMSGTVVRAQHVLDLRAALSEVYGAAWLPRPAFDTSLIVGSVIRAADVTAVRAAILALE
jgi:uncharacterized delta-60 repeat protein